MQQAVQQICFHGMDRSAALEARIRERVAGLEQLCPEMTSCRVTVEKDHRHHVKGNPFNVAVHLHLPGHDLVVSRLRHDGHADVQLALRHAFDAAERQLKEHLRARRDQGKPT